MTKDNRTDEELNRIIAEWIGNPEPHWICIRCNQKVPSSHVTYEETHGIDSCLGSVTWIESPNYCRNLNAVHDAWLKLDNDDKHRFQDALQRVMLCSDLASYWIVGAEARQRAEALVKVIEEGKK